MVKTQSPLKRLQNFANHNPLYGWLLWVAIVLVFDAASLWAMPSLRNPGMILFLICSMVTPPTMHLLHRFSETKRTENPIPPKQEEAVGLLSLLSAFSSIAALFAVMFGKRMGLSLSPNADMSLLFGYVVSLLMALGFGVAAQHTKMGRWGFRIAAGWFFLLVLGIIASVLRPLF